jgi:hypothetical protein
MKLISTVTVGAGGASSITFTSIPATFTDLYLVLSLRNTTSSNEFTVMRMNAVTSGYNWRSLNAEEYGAVGTFAASGLGITDAAMIGMNFGTNATSSTFGSTAVTIPNYAGSTAKTFASESIAANTASAPARMHLTGGTCTSTAAINSLTIYGYFGYSFAQYSTASLYGITKGSGGATVS